MASWRHTTRKEAISPPQKCQDQDDQVLILALVSGQLCSGTFEVHEKVHRSFSTTRYQILDISAGWKHHPYLCLAFGTGWCLPPGTKSAPQVTSKEKYLPLNRNSCVHEIVRELHVRQEVTGSNPSHRNAPYFLLTQCKDPFSTGSSTRY